MLCRLPHGQTPVVDDVSASCATFDYMFPDAGGLTVTKNTVAHLDALFAAMKDQLVDDGNHSALPPFVTYFGQFIDHDLTAEATTDTALGNIFGDTLIPADRGHVVKALVNERTGRFDLDSLYGKQDHTDPTLSKITENMRFPQDRAMMWIARNTEFRDSSGKVLTVANPPDGAGDLLRMDRLLKTDLGATGPRVTEAELDGLPAPIRGQFFRDDGGTEIVNAHRAVIGDSRNDENLFIAQLHLAFLRLHNRMVATSPRRAGDEDAVYAWAKQQVTRCYQWLVVHHYLARICDEKVLQFLMRERSPVYRDFRARCTRGSYEHMPMPLEFSVGAFRMGHSMVRAEYDWNEHFGRPGSILPRAPFDELFRFTGGSFDPMRGAPHLPTNWLADWSRLVGPISVHEDRSARRIDTFIADPLHKMANEPKGKQNLPSRNLRRGVKLDIPVAQSLIASLKSKYQISVKPLTQGQITSGSTGNEVRAGSFDKETPLWFYVLKEAEVLTNGERLGPLGSHLVAGTILGILWEDEQSVLNLPGSVDGRWHPVDGHAPDGVVVDSFPSLMRAAHLL